MAALGEEIAFPVEEMVAFLEEMVEEIEVLVQQLHFLEHEKNKDIINEKMSSIQNILLFLHLIYEVLKNYTKFFFYTINESLKFFFK